MRGLALRCSNTPNLLVGNVVTLTVEIAMDDAPADATQLSIRVVIDEGGATVATDTDSRAASRFGHPATGVYTYDLRPSFAGLYVYRIDATVSRGGTPQLVTYEGTFSMAAPRFDSSPVS